MTACKSPQKEDLKAAYERISHLVNDHILGNGVGPDIYMKDSYQIYIAANLCLNMTPSLCLIYAGQGKTVIMLLCALYLIHEKNMKTVTFVTCSTLLQKQLQNEITKLYPTGTG